RTYARSVADRFATEHTQVVLEPDVEVTLPRLAEAYDEPHGDDAALPLYLICEAARAEVTVALTGAGGDESLGASARDLAPRRPRRRRPGRQAAARRPHLSPARPAREGGHRLDGALVGTALAAPRLARPRARDLAAGQVEALRPSRQGGATAGVRRPAPTRGRGPREEGLRRAALGVVPRRAAAAGDRPPARRDDAPARPAPSRRGEEAAGRARHRARRPRAPALVPRDSRALAAH